MKNEKIVEAQARELISRALSGESVMFAAKNILRFQNIIKFLDVNEELEFKAYRTGFTLKRKNND